MRKLLLISSLLVMFVFLVSCAPQLTDAELEAELAKLTPEQREELLKDLESKEGGTLAGQAIAKKYANAKLTGVSKDRVQAILQLPSCTESDNGIDYTKKGILTSSKFGTRTDDCAVTLILKTDVDSEPIDYDPFYAISDCNQVDDLVKGATVESLGKDAQLISSINTELIIDGWKGCFVREFYCEPTGGDNSYYSTIYQPCPNGCSDGACKIKIKI